jgi:hypothetical protein
LMAIALMWLSMFAISFPCFDKTLNIMQ